MSEKRDVLLQVGVPVIIYVAVWVIGLSIWWLA